MDIRKLREKLGLTSEEMAVRLGVVGRTVKRWELGTHRPSSLAIKRQLKQMEKES